MAASQPVVIASNQTPVSVAGTVIVSNFPTNPSVSGTVLIGNTTVNVSGSVVGFQGTSPWVTTFTSVPSISGTVLVNNGSVVAFQGTTPWVIGSIVGTYAEDATHTSADKGLFVLGVRNDTVASFVSADLEYAPHAGDSAGRLLVKPFAAEEARLDTVSSVVSASVTALFPSVIGLRNYVTDVMIANTGSVSTLVTFKDGSTSVLGYTIAPAGGGSNINGMAIPMRTAPSQDFTYQATTSASVLYVTAKGYKAP